MATITIDGVDVTADVAAMYDAIVGSMDWGSEFLDTETIEAILRVGVLAGFELGVPPPSMTILGVAAPVRNYRLKDSCEPDYREKLEAWRAQVRAKIEAQIAERKGRV